jgi:hypothetical protein
MAAFVAKQMVGNKLNAVKGRPLPRFNYFVLKVALFECFPDIKHLKEISGCFSTPQ